MILCTHQMVNYIRANKSEANEFIGDDVQSKWNDDLYLKPVVVDSWLMFGED